MYRILDLDNCIADDEWRLHLINADEPDLMKRYHQYQMNSIHDRLHNEHLFKDTASDEEVIIFTSRFVCYRDMAKRWLKQHDVRHDRLLMRPMGCFLNSFELKAKQLVVLQFGHSMMYPPNITAAFDDRTDVVEMYKAAGIANAQRVFINDREGVRE